MQLMHSLSHISSWHQKHQLHNNIVLDLLYSMEMYWIDFCNQTPLWKAEVDGLKEKKNFRGKIDHETIAQSQQALKDQIQSSLSEQNTFVDTWKFFE